MRAACGLGQRAHTHHIDYSIGALISLGKATNGITSAIAKAGMGVNKRFLVDSAQSMFLFCSREVNPAGVIMGLDHIRSEIERMRVQVSRQRKEILQLQRAGISTSAAEALLQRMLDKIDALCGERDRLKKDLPAPTKGKVLGGRKW